MTDRRRALSIGLIVGTVLALVFMGGFTAGSIVRSSFGQSSIDTTDANLRDFLSAYHLVTQRSYFRPFNRQHLIYAAIDGMLSATGDPHTLFLSPPENRQADQALNGSQFSGIGAIVVPRGGNLQIVTPLPRTPAALAGIHAGDIVTHINGYAVSRMSGDRAVALIHGRVGTVVHLTVRRGHTAQFIVNVRRAQIPPVTAYGRLLPHHLGYIQIFSFGDTTSQEVADALNSLAKQGVRGIVLDLRGNPGGYVDAAQHVVSQFVSGGIVAYEQQSDKQLQPLPVLSMQHVTHLPVAILVDSGTASAAEITAGALRDAGRAIVIGTRTYGKGSMQSIYALADGSSVRITDRLWLTPRKHSIQKVGIRPDIAIASSSRANDDPPLSSAERYLIQKH